MSTLPTLVFIPGSWHKATCYDKVIKLLRDQHNLKCVSITLPSTSGQRDATFKDDIDTAHQAISNEISQGHNVVVIAHSYGGMVGNSVIKGFPKRQNETGNIIGLILIASGFTLTGFAFMDPFFGYPLPFFHVNKETGFADLITSPQKLFYHDLSNDEADYWTSELTTQTLKSLYEGGEHAYAGWMDVPVWYLGTTEDQGIPVLAQRMQIGMARAMGGHVVHREMQTSHSPFLSRPKETADFINEAIMAFSDIPTQSIATASERKSIAALPQPRLWQPLSWFKFGLPLGFGYLLGRIIHLGSKIRSWWRPAIAL